MLFLHHADDTRRIQREDARGDHRDGCGSQGLAEHLSYRELACDGEPADGRGRHGIDGRHSDVLWRCMLKPGQRQWDAGGRGSCFLHEWQMPLVNEVRGQPAVNRDYIMLGEFSVPR